jgi:hypothetical protein
MVVVLEGAAVVAVAAVVDADTWNKEIPAVLDYTR